MESRVRHPRRSCTAYFLFDAAEVIDLSAVATLVGGTTRVRLTPKTATPSYVQYQQPPLTIDGEAIGLPDALGFKVRFKLFDYGVISVALTPPLPGTWPELVGAASRYKRIRRWPPTCEVALPRSDSATHSRR